MSSFETREAKNNLDKLMMDAGKVRNGNRMGSIVDRLDEDDDDDDDDDDDGRAVDAKAEDWNFDVNDEVRDANKRLKRYVPIFYSPLFYRTDKESLAKQRQLVQSFLDDCMQHPRNRVCPDFLALLEVSAMR